ncbi:3-hydroxybutyryl-CoA dehydrogenase FadB3 [Mycobacteroides abscessus 5S-0422]|uniref:NAD-dependent glycerol-3-phosphate dehydrogenase family protein n=1 Tax=Mycobacteroides abscessus subsp. bolletii 1513 TaxID=1299321 RepID=X8E1W1_9MYCO|nr:3-hydroxyacyl-CoA dehydrogenase family protein [Mycobacteroides abscessus]EUA74221.1 NAD-dependent glycerol-3-phosphate dehydrogenase family protein [Mycobacteroides abscessus subsp. bolletii 1513]EIU06560.1 3-hydroxybutyryl-CoA dehydrogenase FadB3 [Mycobacteroides abscessus 5S-0421]EIU11696.1 3-hydroxybutyryl-CoA dehydrogenase FadB3 [Mycobacteroides abscessus 5S-0304]EIU19241.1 3-hydroxybutyryl-CoA dehydrogenase FadB3 [Mycobacteroides abscessus 5S-0422]EIU25758.1 3-hydroxybutyryl-CoA dehyd
MTYSPPTDIDNRPVAVLGAGTLGRRIALTFATRGGVVHLYDVSEESLQSAKAFLDQRIPELVKTRSALGAQPATIEYFTDLPSAVKDAWYVVESVPEVQTLKIDLLGQLDEIAAPDAVIGTNSSSFMSSELIGKVKHPERFLNTHYGQPPEAPQAELVTDGHTDERIFDVLGAELPKHGFVTAVARKESVGFIINRVWAAVKREALAVVAEGVSTPAEFDRIWVASGMSPIGVFRAIDRVGLDVALDIEDNYIKHFPYIPTTSRDLLQKYVDEGKLGVKSGEGFYHDYPEPSHD